jgi:tetratricopeptide (TPR) repeat protein
VEQELDQALHRSVAELCERGDAHAEQGELDLALERYEEALSLLPRPLSRWNAATWILTAIGDTCFLKKDHRQARSALEEALRCPRGLSNPFIHLRLGQAALELGDDGMAREHLARAYLGAAEDIFAGEDPRYIALAQEAARARMSAVEGE